MDGSLPAPPPSTFVLVPLTLEDLARMNAAARQRPHRTRPSRRSHVIVPPSLWLGLGGEPLILLPPVGARVDPPPAQPDAEREAAAREQAKAWAIANARVDDYGEAFIYAYDRFNRGHVPSGSAFQKLLRRSEFGTGREVSAIEFDDGTSVLDTATTPITASVASGDGDVDGMHLGGHITLAGIRKYAPRWGFEEGHGKDGDWRRPLQHAYYSARAGQLAFAGRLWTARTMRVAA